MLISDVSVRRPVFAAVISLILVIVGLISMQGMSIREYPDIQRPLVSISTSYRGAASDIVERRVTQIIEDQIAGISGITKISSRSFDERSQITVEFSRDRDVDSAANDIRDRIGRVLANLPEEADPPEVARTLPVPSVMTLSPGARPSRMTTNPGIRRPSATMRFSTTPSLTT
ncbi:MAG: efflux RND transporter permease subunit [Pseudomonadota bacterium]